MIKDILNKIIIIFALVIYCPFLISSGELDTIVQKYNLDLQALKKYYVQVQKIGIYIVELLNKTGKIHLNAKLHETVNSGMVQIAPNGAVALDIYGNLPRGFWTPLGYLQINEGGYVEDDQALEDSMKELGARLMLETIDGTYVRKWCSNNYVCNIGRNLGNEELPVVQTVPELQKIPYSEICLLWQEVKPQERSMY